MRAAVGHQCADICSSVTRTRAHQSSAPLTGSTVGAAVAVGSSSAAAVVCAPCRLSRPAHSVRICLLAAGHGWHGDASLNHATRLAGRKPGDLQQRKEREKTESRRVMGLRRSSRCDAVGRFYHQCCVQQQDVDWRGGHENRLWQGLRIQASAAVPTHFVRTGVFSVSRA